VGGVTGPGSRAVPRSAPIPSTVSSTSAPAGGSGGGPGGGPLGRYLRDPGGTVHDLLIHAREWLLGPGRVLVPAAVLAAVAVLVACWWWRRRRAAAMARDGRLVAITPPPTVDPAGAETLWANLVGLLRPAWARRMSGQPHVGFEYRFGSDGVAIELWTPAQVPLGLVERAIEAAWPGAHTSTRPTAPAAVAGNEGDTVATGGVLRLARSEALPIRTDHAADPLRPLLGAPTGLEPGDQAVVQVLARPVTGRRVARARRAARTLHTGGSHRPVGRLLDLLTPHAARPTRAGSGSGYANLDRVSALDYAAQDRAVVVKQRGASFETLIRYAVSTPRPAGNDGDRGARRVAVERVRGRAHAIAAAFAGYAGHNFYTRRRLRHPAETIASRRFAGSGDLLSVPELAALAHLPVDEAVPGLVRAGAQAIAPPPTIPYPGGATVKPLGAADTGRRRPVGLTVADARHHLHVLGATGSGKSTLLAQLILADVTARRGVVVVDPKGDLVTDVLDRLPADALDRVHVLDADARTRPPCLNPLDHTATSTGPGAAGGAGADVVVDQLVSVFSRVYAAWWGPRTDDILRAACLTLTTQPGVPTLADLPRLLGEPAYRHRALASVTDPVLRGFWGWYEQLSAAGQGQAIAPLMNKLRAFLLRPFVRAAVAGGPSTLDMTSVLDEGGVLLVRIPKGSLGQDTTALVGSLVVARVWQAVTARARQPHHQRADAGLYLDEAQNFLTLPYSVDEMLAEARGFRLCLTLAHQHLAQLGRDLREGISANARNKIYFASSPEDARDLARHTTPRLGEHDLTHLGAYHAAARLVVDGADTPAFTLTTTPLPPRVSGRRRAALKAAAHAARPTVEHTSGTNPAQASHARPRGGAATARGGDPRRAA